MPRYFFHVIDGQRYDDLQGSEFADLTGARREAIRYAAALLSSRQEIFWDSSEWKMRVADEADLTLFELHFVAVDSPATTAAGQSKPGG